MITATSFQAFWSVPASGGDNNDELFFWLDGLPFAAPAPNTSEFVYWSDGLPFNGEEY